MTKGYHDIGGESAGTIPKEELPWLHWEKQVEAIRNLLGDGTRRIVSLDEMRRGFESFGEEKYKKYSFYRRRLEAMIDILVEKGVITRAELDRAINWRRPEWERAAAEGALDTSNGKGPR
ncbi:nitrile hydratase [Roseovarius sp. CAU 1744]|uniref:nitrile hydratase n=1 Tax=Roseovarius sp. CAU 1744 TaxID=3140368 RepID=UPI00325C2F82